MSHQKISLSDYLEYALESINKGDPDNLDYAHFCIEEAKKYIDTIFHIVN